MSIDSSKSLLQDALRPESDGMVGLVDRLLRVCAENDLQLECHPDAWRFRSHDGEWQELGPLPLKLSAFRAILSRMAVLCADAAPGIVDPYGGVGEVRVATVPPTICRVEFVNTSDVQRLEVSAKPTRLARATPMIASADA